jgi:hypothetical protein
VLTYFCGEPPKKKCRRSALLPLSLNVSGVGELRVAVGEDPADAVEAFCAAQGVEDMDAVRQIWTHFMQLKPCRREPGPLSLQVC